MAKKAKPADTMQPNNTLAVKQVADETGAQAVARNVLNPGFRHALTASTFANKMLGTSIEHPGLMDYVDHVIKIAGEAKDGELAIASRYGTGTTVTVTLPVRPRYSTEDRGQDSGGSPNGIGAERLEPRIASVTVPRPMVST